MKTFPIFAVPVGGTHALTCVLPEFVAMRGVSDSRQT